MKRQKFTVRFARMEDISVVVEASSYEEAFEKATADEDVIRDEYCSVTNNKTGTVKEFTEPRECDCYESPYSE